jgi:Helicase associated domain
MDSITAVPMSAISEETLAIESLMSMKTQYTVAATPPPPGGPTIEELNQLKTSRAKAALNSWYHRLNELYEFKLMYGHCDVPQKYPANRCLGIWVNKQRCEKVMYEENENHKTNLTPEKLIALEKIGFVWAKRKGDVIWNQRYNELLAFYKENGHSDLPCKYKPKPTLGRWVTSQRSMYKRGTLPSDYVQKLDDIGFTWDMYAKANEEMESSTAEEQMEETHIETNKCIEVGGGISVVSNSDQEKTRASKRRKRSTSLVNSQGDDNNVNSAALEGILLINLANALVGSTIRKENDTYSRHSTDLHNGNKNCVKKTKVDDEDDSSTITEVTDDELSAVCNMNEV